VDTNGDSLISYEEAEAVTSLIVGTWDEKGTITDMTGLEAFSNLEILDCQDNKIENIDVSNNTALTYFFCIRNQLTSLDVSNNTALENLYCWDNQITSLDVSNNTSLTLLACSANQLTSLDVSYNMVLTQLICHSNQLTSLDLSNNNLLLELSCGGNLLTSLDISNNQLIGTYIFDNYWLDNFDLRVKNMPTLGEVCVWESFLLSFVGFERFFRDSNTMHIDTTGSPNVYFTTECGANFVNIPDTAFLHALIDEGVDTNGDSLISYREAEAVKSLWVYNKEISDLTGIEAFVNLDTLSCQGNSLTNLDVSHNTMLTVLGCGENQLSSLDISNNTSLTLLICQQNQLTTLDVSHNTTLTHLWCWGNQLSALDISSNTFLKELLCENNQLSSLDISNNTGLIKLWCGENQLSRLDISNNPEIESLRIRDMPTLIWVCVWTMPFPPEGVEMDTTGSPDVILTTDCPGVGIKEYHQTGLHIYPNPMTDLFTIETDNPDQSSIEVTKLNGQLIYRGEIKGTSHQIDLSSCQNGIYFITIRSKDFVTTRKIIKL